MRRCSTLLTLIEHLNNSVIIDEQRNLLHSIIHTPNQVKQYLKDLHVDKKTVK